METETITITLHPEYTGILAEIAYWIEHSNSEQLELLITSLRSMADAIDEDMPSPLE